MRFDMTRCVDGGSVMLRTLNYSIHLIALGILLLLPGCSSTRQMMPTPNVH
mgnify:CR=1